MDQLEHGEENNHNPLVLIDSDAFIGWILTDDAHHERASQMFEHLMAQRIALTTTSFTVAETATVLSHLAGQQTARTFLIDIVEERQLPIIFITEALHQAALTIFKEQKKKGTSVNDCANVAVMRQFEIPMIFSFDQVYTKDFALKTVEHRE